MVFSWILTHGFRQKGFVQEISVEVARRWLLSMGFKVSRITKGIYVDGQERADV